MLTEARDTSTRTVALGPDMGQCCGGRVRLLWERFTEATLPDGDTHCRPIADAAPSLKVQQIQSRACNQGEAEQRGKDDPHLGREVPLLDRVSDQEDGRQGQGNGADPQERPGPEPLLPSALHRLDGWGP